MLWRWCPWFISSDRNKRKEAKVKYIKLNDLNTINRRSYGNSGENLAIPKEGTFKNGEKFKGSYSSSHQKLVQTLMRYKEENLDEYTSEQAKAVMKKAYPIFEKIFLEKSHQKIYTAWLALFYALTAKHPQFNYIFRDFLEESWIKSDHSKQREEAYDFIRLVALDDFLTRRLLQSNLSCYDEFIKEMQKLYYEI